MSIQVRDGTAEPCQRLWFVTGRGGLVGFTLLRLDHTVPPFSEPFVVAEGCGIYDPLFCFVSLDNAEKEAAEFRKTRRELAQADMVELGEAGA